MNDRFEGNRDDRVIPLSGARFVRSFCVALAAFGVLTALVACGKTETRVVRVPVEKPVKVEVPVEVLVEKPRCELPKLDEGRKFLVEAWAIPDANFDVGEPLRLQMRVSTPAYMNVFHVSTSCKVTRLLHNRSMPTAQIVDFPLPESGLQMTVKPPAGDEAFYFIATRTPMDFLSGADILGETAGIASLDLSPAQFYQRRREAMGRINPDDWSMRTLHTTIIGR